MATGTESQRGRPREKVRCMDCDSRIIHLKRHYRQVHPDLTYPRERVLTDKSGYRYRECPIPTCKRILSRMNKHLQVVHGMISKSFRSSMVKRAVVVTDEFAIPVKRRKSSGTQPPSSETRNPQPQLPCAATPGKSSGTQQPSSETRNPQPQLLC